MSNLDDLFICTNPTRRDVKNIYRNEKYARGILLKNGDMVVWNGDVMHSKVLPFLTETANHKAIILSLCKKKPMVLNQPHRLHLFILFVSLLVLHVISSLQIVL